MITHCTFLKVWGFKKAMGKLGMMSEDGSNCGLGWHILLCYMRELTLICGLLITVFFFLAEQRSKKKFLLKKSQKIIIDLFF